MFRNRSFRFKLALAVAPPILVLVGLVFTIVRPKLQTVTDTELSLVEARVATANMQYRDEVQVERDITLQYLFHPELEADLTDHRRLADQLAGEFIAEFRALDSGAVQDFGKIQGAVDAIDDLRELRTRIDAGGMTTIEVNDAFNEIFVAHLELNDAISLAASDAELVRQADVIRRYHEAKDGLANYGALVGLSLEEGQFPASTVAEVTSLSDASEANFARFASSASPQMASTYAQAIQAAEARRMDELTATVLAADGLEVPAIDDEDWWQAAADNLEAIDVVEDIVFNDFIDQATVLHDDAQRSVYLNLALAVGVSVLAAAAALLLGRSLARRLADISEQAHEIAHERLPDVLDALRNPSAEVLASAIPQVSSDASDEIGDMAESFNTVLTTAVQTSIEHSQRRAETLTNILVNLGRRNQALLERQLNIIDGLESSQEDPEVLEQLFEIDHMMTRMRRNAENLLVLASAKPARQWRQPVPLVDVVRGAAAEVQDLSRVDFDVPGADRKLVLGNYAVDLSHLLAELIENASAYSPPSARVQVRSEGHATSTRLWVIDNGVGMTPDQLAEANERVSDPADVDAMTTDQIGFQVVGRLARRLKAEVSLMPNPGGGTAVSVVLPLSMFDTGEDISAAAAERPSARQADPSPVANLSDDGFGVARDGRRREMTDGIEVVLDAADRSPLGQPIPSDASSLLSMPTPERIEPSVPTSVEPAAWTSTDERPFPGDIFEPQSRADQQSTGIFSNGSSPSEHSNGSDPLPASESASPGVTASGIEKRIPGGSLNEQSPAVAAFESGQLRRLPTGDEQAKPQSAGVDDEARRRLEVFRRLQTSVNAGRSDDNPNANHESNGGN